ncbi:MAG TPA: hypothetical protein VMG30_12910 [Acidobacteriota bacterium]|nr:hypothetical protein [Acidobacteriota bacterium]
MMISTYVKAIGLRKILARYLLPAVILILMIVIGGPQLFAENEATVNPSRNRDQSSQTDFSFTAPKGFLGFRIGRFFPQADSDFFDMVTKNLTLEKSDFQSWDFGIDGGADLQKRVELIFSFDYSRRTKASEFRNYVDANNLPITQTTRIEQIPLTGGVKFLLIPRGRGVGKFAWLPSAIVPYIGGGAGVLWYRLEQEGDFVDESSNEIFSDHLTSSGWAPTVYAGGGADIHVFKTAFLTLDLRYVYAKPELNREFVSFKSLDLSGLRVSAGLQFHF